MHRVAHLGVVEGGETERVLRAEIAELEESDFRNVAMVSVVRTPLLHRVDTRMSARSPFAGMIRYDAISSPALNFVSSSGASSPFTM